MRKEWNEETIGRVFGIIDEALYSMALYSEINPSDRDNTVFDPYLRKFWMVISDNAVLMSVIQWCKIFGSEGNNKTHYSHFVDRELFKRKLNNISYEVFSDSMKNVRDKFAAHEDKEEDRVEIPSFDTARKIMEAVKKCLTFAKSMIFQRSLPYLSHLPLTDCRYGIN